MDLIERYLEIAARGAGAGCSGDDVSAGLSALLMARIEAREAGLRRPLGADEAVAELAVFARRLLAEGRAVLSRLEAARLCRTAAALDIPEGGS